MIPRDVLLGTVCVLAVPANAIDSPKAGVKALEIFVQPELFPLWFWWNLVTANKLHAAVVIAKETHLYLHSGAIGIITSALAVSYLEARFVCEH